MDATIARRQNHLLARSVEEQDEVLQQGQRCLSPNLSAERPRPGVLRSRLFPPKGRRGRLSQNGHGRFPPVPPTHLYAAAADVIRCTARAVQHPRHYCWLTLPPLLNHYYQVDDNMQDHALRMKARCTL